MGSSMSWKACLSSESALYHPGGVQADAAGQELLSLPAPPQPSSKISPAMESVAAAARCSVSGNPALQSASAPSVAASAPASDESTRMGGGVAAPGGWNPGSAMGAWAEKTRRSHPDIGRPTEGPTTVGASEETCANG